MAVGDYARTTYVNDTTPAINAANLNNIEAKVLELDTTFIMMKKLTGTTNADEGGAVTVAHGLTSTKIVGFTVIVQYSAGSGISFQYDLTTDCEFFISYDATNFTITNHATNSGHILSKPISIVVTYEA